MPIKLAIPLVICGVGSAAASSYGIYFNISKNGKDDGTQKGDTTKDTPATEESGSATPQKQVTDQSGVSTPGVAQTEGQSNHSDESPQGPSAVQPQVSTGASDSTGTEQKTQEQASELQESSGEADTTKENAGSSGSQTGDQVQQTS